MPEDQTPVKASGTDKFKSSDPTLTTPPDHVRLLHGHPEARGNASVAESGGRWRENIIPLQELPGYVKSRAGQEDIFLSQNRFDGRRRRIVNLTETTGLWADLDIYRTKQWQDRSPDDVTFGLLRRIDDEDIPLPSYVLFTGRGLLAVWLLDKPLHRRALPRWHAAEQHLIEKLKGFGADMKAADAARVFRLVGSLNSRSGEEVRAIWQSERTWGFDELCEAILPWTREEVKQFRAKGARKAALSLKGIDLGLRYGSLWTRRLLDLRQLRFVRWFGPLPEGQRDEWLFLSSVALSWICPAHALEREVLQLGREALGCTWSDREIRGQMGSAIARAHAAAQGKKILWQGEMIDPRYRFRTETIIERLEITEAEMREGKLNTLLTPQVMSERQAEKGRASGEARRKANAERDEMIVAMVRDGQSMRSVARAYGINEKTVRHIMKRGVRNEPV